ncbi:MAG: hypothetical protein FWF52_11625 [Candidatus Azobacteroides sp.]|nr:hypothetical protein [Candidatus Azobacteroides sp.]
MTLTPLEDAIDFYCGKLTKLDENPNPHDDTRLYAIAYHSYKSNVPVTVEMFFKCLKINKKLNYHSDETLITFAENKIKRINFAKYILSRMPGWIV